MSSSESKPSTNLNRSIPNSEDDSVLLKLIAESERKRIADMKKKLQKVDKGTSMRPDDLEENASSKFINFEDTEEEEEYEEGSLSEESETEKRNISAIQDVALGVKLFEKLNLKTLFKFLDASGVIVESDEPYVHLTVAYKFRILKSLGSEERREYRRLAFRIVQNLRRKLPNVLKNMMTYQTVQDNQDLIIFKFTANKSLIMGQAVPFKMHQERSSGIIKPKKKVVVKLITQKFGPDGQGTQALASRYLSVGVQYYGKGPKIPPSIRRAINKKSRFRQFTLPRMRKNFQFLMCRAGELYSYHGLAVDSFNKIIPIRSELRPSFLDLPEAEKRPIEKYQVDQKLRKVFAISFHRLSLCYKSSHQALLARTFDPAGLGLDKICTTWRILGYYPFPFYITQMKRFIADLHVRIKTRWLTFVTTVFEEDTFLRDCKEVYAEIKVQACKRLVVLFRSLYVKLIMDCYETFISHLHHCKLAVEACITNHSQPVNSQIMIEPSLATITKEYSDAILEACSRVAMVPIWQILPARYVDVFSPIFSTQLMLEGCVIKSNSWDSARKIHDDLFQGCCAMNENMKNIYIELSEAFESISSGQDFLSLMDAKALSNIINMAKSGQQLTYSSHHIFKNFKVNIETINQLWKPLISELSNRIIDSFKKDTMARIESYAAEIQEIFSEIDVPIRDGIQLMEMRDWVIQSEKGPLRTITRFSRKIFLTLLNLSSWSEGITSITNLSRLCKKLRRGLKDASNNILNEKFTFEDYYLAELKRFGGIVKTFFAERIHGYQLFSFLEYIELNHYHLADTFRDLRALDEQADVIVKNLDALQLRYNKATDLRDFKDTLFPMAKLAVEALQWQILRNNVMFGPRELVDFEAFEKELDNTIRKFRNFNKEFKKKSKKLVLERSAYLYEGVPDSLEETELSGPLRLIAEVLASLREMKALCPILKIITNPSMVSRHWLAIAGIADVSLDDYNGLTVFGLLEKGLKEFLSQLEPISTAATREAALKKTLDEMIREWNNVKFNLIFSPKLQTNVLGSMEEIQLVLDDHLGKTLGMKGSAFVKPHKSIVVTWFDTLFNLDKLLKDWAQVQIQWMYFFPIFSSPDILRQMPAEGTLFQEVSTSYIKVLGYVKEDPRVLELSKKSFVRQVIANDLELLDKITTGVNAYLEEKRLLFPRFFFLSNDDMLEILSETKEPTKVQNHLSKCFEGIARLSFDKRRRVWAMNSAEKEEVRMYKRIETRLARGSVEKWLVWVECMMKKSIKKYVTYANKKYTISRRDKWIQSFPGQVVLCVTQIHWTFEMGKCFASMNPISVLRKYLICLQTQLNKVIKLVRGQLPALTRVTLSALVVLDVHSRDTTELLWKKRIHKVTDFEWLSQLRYYGGTPRILRPFRKKPKGKGKGALLKVKMVPQPPRRKLGKIIDKNIFICMMTAKVDYAFEYLGNTTRLVITPLTDRCYRTLIGAFALHLNGAPEGPAGTGKTETIKDLAKAIAVQCIVFNCSDGLDYLAMQKFFKGLASCGAWACFDEFNRIEIEVLSVIAQQILSIIQAVRLKLEKFNFEGTEISLNPACYVCITMNPGYAGRSELPDNLKVLFRTVAMMVPDYALIGEISLYSCGFLDARPLSKKIVTTYRLCSEQLSSQSHYDYGMRAVKTVLSTAGNLKLRFPTTSEESLILRAINDVNLPKFLNYDVPLFQGIIRDLFPTTSLKPISYDELLNCTKQVCQNRNLQPVDAFLIKIVQTYEMMLVRHGFMLVGDPFSGKSSTLKVLCEALTLEFQLYNKDAVTKYQTLNPKSVTMGQLYGQFDPVSHEWSDGIIAKVFRDFARETTSDRKWVVFDGPVDAVWIENMNTVLDDNKKLCLNSGETIQMTPVMSMIFEVMDLVQASPATVSRCGMIYMESATLGWKPFVESWNNTIPNEWHHGDNKRFIKYLEWLLPPCLEYTKKYGKRLTFAGEINMVMTVCDIFVGMLRGALDRPGQKEIEDIEYYSTWVQATMMTAVFWGIGGTLDTPSRVKFDAFYKELWSEHQNWPSDYEEITVNIPPNGLIEDNAFQYFGTGMWLNFESALQDYKKPTTGSSNIVPTTDTLKIRTIMEVLVSCKKPFLLTGPTGTGKSTSIKDLFLNGINLEIFMPSLLTFTATVSCNKIQELVLSNLIRKRKGLFAPTGDKVAIIFGDDINMPEKEIYGAQPPLELIRQFFDYGFWYDLESLHQILLENVYIIAAMGLPGGSRQDVYARFLRHFSLFALNTLKDESMVKIFSETMISSYRERGFSTDYIQVLRDIVEATLSMFQWSLANLLPTPKKCHYLFNIRDINRVIQGHLLLRKGSPSEKKNFVRMWTHETLRVYYDRLVEESDREMFLAAMKEIVKRKLKENFDVMLDGITHDEENKEVKTHHMDNLLFTSALNADEDEEDRVYEEVVSHDNLFYSLNNSLESYNKASKNKIDIVLFKYAVSHMIRICRIISIPGDHGLLVGISGCGRRSLVRLATYIYEIPLFAPEITKHYGIDEWHDDIKAVLKSTGIDNRPYGFLFGDSQASEEFFLQDIDVLLNTGEVPNIFALDEMVEIVESVRVAAQGGDRHLNYPRYRVYSFFRDRCKRNLHILLCFSPIGDGFRKRIRIYPTLVNCCTVDWLEDWPEEAIEIVAWHYLVNVNIVEDLKDSVVKAFKYFHVKAKDTKTIYLAETSREVFYTCKSFIDLVNSYAVVYDKKSLEVMKTVRRYDSGRRKLKFAEAQVMIMQRDLDMLMPAIKENAQNVMKVIGQILVEQVQVEEAVALIEEEELEVQKQALEAEFCKTECTKELSLLLPIITAAIKALNTIKKEDITLLKSMSKPPIAVRIIMSAVCVMLGENPDRIRDPSKPGHMMDDYWAPSKRLLGNINLMNRLGNFDKDNIPPQRIAAIRTKYLKNPLFKPEIVAKASQAARGLCEWIIALEKYVVVMKTVAPKQAKLRQAEEDFRAVQARLQEKQAALDALKAKLQNLQDAKDAGVAKEEALKQELELCKIKLNKATFIIDSLGGEQIRWKLLQEEYQNKLDNLPGDVLISCGIITYLGPLPADLRAELTDDWLSAIRALNIPTSENYSLSGTLGSEVIILQWALNGLPNDPFSVDNALIADSALKFSLMIDPQSQANKWIKRSYANRVNVIKLSRNYMPILEYSIQEGGVLLLEDIGETIDAALEPLIKQQFFYEGTAKFVAIGDSVLLIHDDFQFFITTKLVNPRFAPEIYNKLTVINFALTIDGLTDQLVSKIISMNRPELENLRKNLVIESALNKARLEICEAKIIECLQRKDLLTRADTTMILERSKLTAEFIAKKEKEAEKTNSKIDSLKTEFRPVSKRCSQLYYTVVELPEVDPMYQFSLDWFISIYENVIRKLLKANVNEQELFIKRLSDDFHLTVYQSVMTSLFNKDRVLYSFIFAVTTVQAEGASLVNELSFLLTGGIALTNTPPTVAPWLPKSAWEEICRVHSVPSFKVFRKHFVENLREWRRFYTLSLPTFTNIPPPWRKTLTIFEQLLIFRMLRPDRLKSCIEEFVEHVLGDRYTIPQFTLEKTIESCRPFTPIIFILSAGADPMGSLVTLSEEKQATLLAISLGQGQGPVAENMIRKKLQPNHWICLQNCHLLTSWMPDLEALCEELPSMKDENQIPGFRLFLTSYPSNKFPVAVLQNGIKIINEAPAGLKNSLLHCYNSDLLSENSFYNSCRGKEFMFHRLLLGISFFHAVVLERRTFGPIGWNIPYGFNDSDYDISVIQLQLFLKKHRTSPYAAILYLTGECNYGGRVTDDWDRRTLNTLIKRFVNKQIVRENSFSLCPGNSAFVVPRTMLHSNVVSFINSLPAEMPTEVCGLHSNAGITREILDMDKLQNSLLKVLHLGSERSAEEDSLLLSISTGILEKLPERFDIEQAMKAYPTVYAESMNTVLVQEMERFNKLLDCIKKSIRDLVQALKGSIVMTSELEAVSTSLLTSKIPPSWGKYSYPSLKPLGSYITDFVKRLQFLEGWYQKGKPKTFWLSGFFFTQAFLTGALQNYARRYSIPIDLLTYDFEVLKKKSQVTAPKDGVIVYGIFIVGARWDKEANALEEEVFKILSDELPLLWIKPIKRELFQTQGRYTCPLYKTSERRGTLSTTGHSTNYVIPILLGTQKPPDHWVLRGVACLCQLDE